MYRNITFRRIRNFLMTILSKCKPNNYIPYQNVHISCFIVDRVKQTEIYKCKCLLQKLWKRCLNLTTLTWWGHSLFLFYIFKGHIHHDPKEHDDILGGPDEGNDREIPCDEQEELGHEDASHGTGANARRRCKTRGNNVDRNENITQLHPHVRASEVILNANENDQPNATTTRDEDGSASDDESSESSDNDGDGSEEDRVYCVVNFVNTQPYLFKNIN